MNTADRVDVNMLSRLKDPQRRSSRQFRWRSYSRDGRSAENSEVAVRVALHRALKARLSSTGRVRENQ